MKQSTKTSTDPVIIRRTSVIGTLRAIKPGQSATYRARDLGLYTSACSAVSRLNAAAPGSYAIATDDNGATYTVTRNR